MDPADRVRALVAAARRLADPGDPLGREARALLPESTGLSPENVELGLSEILETQPSEADLRALCASVEAAPRVHVLLAANVFSAPLRAIALGLAQSDEVFVRVSRREPVFARLLQQASGAFELTETLAPRAGDHVWAYGTDVTLTELERGLPDGVVLHAHGSGFGVALIDGDPSAAALELARDIVPFDQRGCLSPRVAVVTGTRDEARELARALALELARAAQRVPLGRLDDDERAECLRMREALTYAGEVLAAGPGWVALDDASARLLPAPAGRNLVVVPSGSDLEWLSAHAAPVAALGVTSLGGLGVTASRLFPEARLSPLGQMQRPRLDGPVDRRSRALAHRVTRPV